MTDPAQPSPRAQAPDFVLVSDLHLGEGQDPATGRYSRMEEFFYDAPFARLLDHLRERYGTDPDSLVLVINGDGFDFLTMTKVPTPAEAAEQGIEVRPAERRFGLNPTATKASWELDRIVEGHPVFFAALARFAAAGFRVEILRGNHDLELAFEAVQQRLREHLCQMEGGPSAEQAAERIRFHQWFLLEEGRLYIEHGNQYESSNSIRYPLRPFLPVRRRRGEREDVLDYPLGSLFVRYFYNSVHRINPYRPKLVSFEQYVEFMRRYNLIDVLRIAREHYPFFVRSLRPQATGGTSGPTREADDRQQQDFAACDSQVGVEELSGKINALKVHPKAASKLALVQAMSRPVMRRLAVTGGIAFGTLYVWLLLFSLIQGSSWLVENVFAKAILMAFLAITTGAAVIWVASWLDRKLRRQTDPTAEMLADRADRIARLTGAKLVLMGHTHLVDVRPVADGRATYANSGTWVAMDNPWEMIEPEARRYTLLVVKGDRVQVSRWNDDAGRIDPVPMFDLAPGEKVDIGEPPLV